MAHYNTDEYPIVVGNSDSGNALCVSWQNAFGLADRYPTLTNQCAIIGSLYVAQGINVMIRNLALNPGIRVLYLWRQGRESLSQRGMHATNILLELWEKGVNDMRMCSDFTLEKEISVSVFNTVRASVEIRVIDEVSESRLLEVISQNATNPYMEPHSFPDPVYETPAVFPSEKVGFVVRSKTVESAWLEAVFHINRFGDLYEGRGTPYRRLGSLTWVIEDETGDFPECVHIPKTLQKKLQVAREQVADYAITHFFEYGLAHSDAGPHYTYGERMHNWGGQFNQVEAAVALLKKDPATRQAYVAISEPARDLLGNNTQPPCLVGIQFLQDQGSGALDAYCVFRSHDIFQAGLSNAFGVLYVLRSVAEEVAMRQGRVSITSHDAHIYLRDLSDARQLVECVWDNKSIELTEEDMDPRGSFRVHINEGRIIVEFVSATGQSLQRFSGTTANVLCRKMAPYYLTSPDQSAHACYLGMELMKAEWCLRNGKEYIQDETLW